MAEMSKEEQIGFHKGALSVLIKEREEMAKIVGIVEQLMNMHIKSLKELGVDLQQEPEAQQQVQEQSGSDKPIEDILK